MKSQTYTPKKENVVINTNQQKETQEPEYTQGYTYAINTMTTPELRILEEIKMMLLILIIIKFICLIRKK